MEARALINQIQRIIGPPPEGTGFKVLSCPHDFGTYYDVAVIYNDSDEESEAYMLRAESELPSNWDDEAIKELKSQGYPVGELSNSIR
jgi:hypothetical protein